MPVNAIGARNDFFSGLDDKVLKEITGACVQRRFGVNEIIVRQGEMGRGLYLISRGRVKVEREQSGVYIAVADLGPDEFFGEMSLLDNKPSPVTATGIEDSECVLLPRDRFAGLMNKYPEIPIRMARVLAERLRMANEDLAAGPAPAPPAMAQPSPPVSPRGKELIHNKLLETFQNLYTIKALSRFSVAVLGCPVEGTAANTVDQIHVGDVKALFFRAGEPVDMRIAALEPGWFTLDVFTPFGAGPHHFGPLAVSPGDRVRMTVTSGEVKLHLGERVISS